MKTGYTHITILLDRSGSMGSVAQDVRGGIKQFIEEQAALGGDCTISIHQFDGEYQTDASFVSIKDINPAITFEPRGMTALYDGVGKTIRSTGLALAAMKEEDRPEKHIFVIFTDGAENASREYTYEMIKPLIEEHTDKYSWEFLFLGANIDAVSVGGGMGLMAGKTMSYDVHNTVNVYSTLSIKAAAYRSGADASISFNDEDRIKAMNQGQSS